MNIMGIKPLMAAIRREVPTGGPPICSEPTLGTVARFYTTKTLSGHW